MRYQASVMLVRGRRGIVVIGARLVRGRRGNVVICRGESRRLMQPPRSRRICFGAVGRIQVGPW